jgi:hypothetical protein
MMEKLCKLNKNTAPTYQFFSWGRNTYPDNRERVAPEKVYKTESIL